MKLDSLRSQPAMSLELSHGETVALPAGTWRYEHDGLGRRTSKVELDGLGEPIETTRVRYLYGPEGLLHGETAPGGATLASVYIWLNGEPIGLIRNDTLYHIHPDHLGRPEVITDASRNVVWRAVLHPWDRTVATTSIGAFNLGFPGQYRDAESGQWYNYFRTYDGSIGRYTQADPIGLAGGMNSFAYVSGNPISLIDPMGLCGEEHKYAIRVPTLCSTRAAMSAARLLGISAPGAPYARGGTNPNVQLWGNGSIEQTVHFPSRTIINATEEGHPFHPGQVSWQFTPRSSGIGSTITVAGTGTGPNPLLNNVIGYAFFGSSAVVASVLCALFPQ